MKTGNSKYTSFIPSISFSLAVKRMPLKTVTLPNNLEHFLCKLVAGQQDVVERTVVKGLIVERTLVERSTSGKTVA